MSFGGGTENDEVLSEINMTPLVDVMLVLLIIFIITVPVLTHTVNIDLPKVDSVASSVEIDTVYISVAQNSEIYWNDIALNFEQLELRLATAALQSPQVQIQLRGASEVQYNAIMQVMSAVQKAGIVQLGFATEPM
ncbi:MAG: biopolymer transport protein ExbD [Flavobacteriales bacterium]|jgi:biopolymer transport protein ExbD